MSDSLFTNLEWLPKPPENFSALCQDVLGSAENTGRRIRALAGFGLDSGKLNRLAKIITGKQKGGQTLAPLTPFRLGILSNATIDFIVPALVASAARHGIALECIAAKYDQAVQEALSPASAVNQAQPDGVLLALDHRSFSLNSPLGDRESALAATQSALAHLDMIRTGIHTNTKATCLVQTVAAPPEALFGSLDRALPGALRSAIDGLNRNVAESVLGTGDALVDVAGLAETVGLAEWHSPRDWNLAKLPFADKFLPIYADYVARVIAALRGKSRRCLVLDLDNTVWGGIIGDDGLQGIELGQGNATGEAHLAVQRLALSLRDRGVVLAVCSKNEDSNARLPFHHHPDMLLREDHIAVFKANWNDKATNLRAIADELSLGLESLVLLDDSVFERDLVRQMLPEVAVPDLPSDPALYARTLSAAGYFESAAFSPEDLQRAGFYQQNAQRHALQQTGDLKSYLASLEMEITFQPFDATGRARIAQLVNKSNQFNLTTRRYSEAEIAGMERDSGCFTLQVRLSDRFGDNGMISVVICRERPSQSWEIDTWLMSCRVLGRGVESMVLNEILHHARGRGIHRLSGTYIPTERNKLVEDHYRKLGFTPLGQSETGATEWVLDVETASVDDAPMRVRRPVNAAPEEQARAAAVAAGQSSE
jgi:FkbH-like protein